MALSLSLSLSLSGERRQTTVSGRRRHRAASINSEDEKDGHRAASINSEDFSRTHKHSAALTLISSVSLSRFSSGSIGSTSQEIDSLSSQDRSIDFTLSSHRSSLSAKRPIDLRKNQSALQLTVSPGQRSSIFDDEGVTLVGSGQDAANLINQKEIHWGIKDRLIQFF
ncbi:hypothetical protein ACSBR1_016250 [Camellia fascicularis]